MQFSGILRIPCKPHWSKHNVMWNYTSFGSAIKELTYAYSSGGDTSKYRYGFNGMEKDNETTVDGGSYDFGARIYNSRLGRWLSLDILQSKYPSLSPYCNTGNSPLLFKDPDGKLIVINYYSDEKDLKGNPIMKQYVYGSKMEVPNNTFVQETIAALDMIASVNISQYKNTEEFPTPADMLSRLTTDGTHSVYLNQSYGGSAHDHEALGKPDETSVKFNPYAVRYTYNSNTGDFEGWMSPASTLTHELKHAFNYLFYQDQWSTNRGSGWTKECGAFPNLEEMYTTTRTENDFNAYYGYGQRSGYYYFPYRTNSATSNQPLIIDFYSKGHQKLDFYQPYYVYDQFSTHQVMNLNMFAISNRLENLYSNPNSSQSSNIEFTDTNISNNQEINIDTSRTSSLWSIPR